MPSVEQFHEARETVLRKVGEVNTAIRQNETMQNALEQAKQTLEQILEKFPDLPERPQFQKTLTAMENLVNLEKLEYPRAVVRDTFEHVVAMLDRLYHDVKPVISDKTRAVLEMLEEVKDVLGEKKGLLVEKTQTIAEKLTEKKDTLVERIPSRADLVEQIPSRVSSARSTIVSKAAEIDDKYCVSDMLTSAFLKIKEKDEEKLNGVVLSKIGELSELSEKYTPCAVKGQIELLRSEWAAAKDPVATEEPSSDATEQQNLTFSESNFASVASC